MLSIAAACSNIAVEAPQPSAPEARTTRQPVLVELFTSEGCSSCPPADRELAFLDTNQPVAGADVITLAFHVDYWDGPDWKDRFSSAEFSERQNRYVKRMKLGSSYTPQMVVDGQSELVGSDGRAASDAIAAAAHKPKAAADIKMTAGKADIAIASLADHGPATVYFASAEDGLGTDIKGGENRGEHIQHVSVVRKLSAVGQLAADAKEFKVSTPLAADPAWKAENLKYIVFVQEDATGRIIAAGKAKAAVISVILARV